MSLRTENVCIEFEIHGRVFRAISSVPKSGGQLSVAEAIEQIEMAGEHIIVSDPVDIKLIVDNLTCLPKELWDYCELNTGCPHHIEYRTVYCFRQDIVWIPSETCYDGASKRREWFLSGNSMNSGVYSWAYGGITGLMLCK